MRWKSTEKAELTWSGPISNREEKEQVAQEIAELVRDGDVIGVGSGSTSFVAIQAVGRKLRLERLSCMAIPTSAEMALACAALEIPVTTLQQARPDWSFDGCDEVDTRRNLIKGRGGALFQEKLLMKSSRRTHIIVDRTKIVTALGTNFPVPIEVHQLALPLVEEELNQLGASEITLRLAKQKDGPVITENGNFLLDAKFPHIEDTLEKEIKKIPGVIESGLFIGYNPEVIVAGHVEFEELIRSLENPAVLEVAPAL